MSSGHDLNLLQVKSKVTHVNTVLKNKKAKTDAQAQISTPRRSSGTPVKRKEDPALAEDWVTKEDSASHTPTVTSHAKRHIKALAEDPDTQEKIMYLCATDIYAIHLQMFEAKVHIIIFRRLTVFRFRHWRNVW